MSATSAGLVIWRRGARAAEILLVHPGGPFWRRRDRGAWSIPKGLVEPGEAPLAAARREAMEELGQAIEGEFAPLAPIRQAGGKRVLAFAVRADVDVTRVQSNEIEMEWPCGSGRRLRFPEIDRAQWFDRDAALEKILPAQTPLFEAAFAIAAREP